MTTDTALDRARAGDDQAFGELTGPYLAELRLHCYRILGSVQDAEDMLQETLLAAWRGLGQYEGRAGRRLSDDFPARPVSVPVRTVAAAGVAGPEEEMVVAGEC